MTWYACGPMTKTRRVRALQVLHVEDGICKVHYEGPAPIGMGIQAAIKDKFPDIRLVQGC